MEQRCNTILSLGLVYRLLFSLSAPLAQSASLALASSPLPSSSRFLSGCLAPSRPGGDAGTSVLGAASPRAATYLGGRVSSTLGGTTPSCTPGGLGGGSGGRSSPGGGRSSPGSGAPLVTYPVLDEGSGVVPLRTSLGVLGASSPDVPSGWVS